MKDFKYIASKLFRSSACLIVLVVCSFFAVCLNVFNRPNVYASEQLAFIDCSVSIEEGATSQLINRDVVSVSNLNNVVTKFCNADVKLSAKSKLVYSYNIQNISNGNCSVSLNLEKQHMHNIKIDCIVDDCYYTVDNFKYILPYGEYVEVKVCIYVNDISETAMLAGGLNLNISGVGENNGR